MYKFIRFEITHFHLNEQNEFKDSPSHCDNQYGLRVLKLGHTEYIQFHPSNHYKDL